MSEQTRKTRKPKAESLFEGDGIRILPTSSVPMVRTGQIVLKDMAWYVVELWDGPLDADGQPKTVWINLKPGH